MQTGSESGEPLLTASPYRARASRPSAPERNGTIIDGAASPPWKGDLCIRSFEQTPCARGSAARAVP
jgi:hypothetical protein